MILPTEIGWGKSRLGLNSSRMPYDDIVEPTESSVSDVPSVDVSRVQDDRELYSIFNFIFLNNIFAMSSIIYY